MLEALNQVLFCVIRDYEDAQNAFLPLIKLLLPLLGRVNGCADVIKEILSNNEQVVKQLSDQDINTMVNLLRTSAPKAFLRRIGQHMPDLPGDDPYLVDHGVDELEERLERTNQRIVALITDVLLLVCTSSDRNKLRVLDALMLETVPAAKGAAVPLDTASSRLALELDMINVREHRYRVAMEHIDWRTSPEVSYHLSMIKIITACLNGSTTLCEVCLGIDTGNRHWELLSCSRLSA